MLWSTVQMDAQKNMLPELNQKVKETLKENGQTIRFMENKGQVAKKEVLYYFDANQGSVYIEKNKIVFVAKDYEIKKKKFLGENDIKLKATHTFSINLLDANPNPEIVTGESFRTKYHYYLSPDSKKWVNNVQATKELTFDEIYPGIDLRLYSTPEGSVEFDWILAPGADYNKIKLDFDGTDKLSIDKEGNLTAKLRFTSVNFHIPESYQVTNHGKFPVSFSFVKLFHNTIAFKPRTAIDPNYPLVIDPTLVWGTYMDDLNQSPGPFDQYLFAIQLVPRLEFCMQPALPINKSLPIRHPMMQMAMTMSTQV